MYEAFFRYLSLERRLSEHTLLAYKTDLQQFADFLRQTEVLTPPSAVSYQDIRGWIIFLMESGLHPRSINRKMATLRAFFSFQCDHDHRQDNPCDFLQSLKTPERLPEVIREKELTTLLDETPFPETFDGLRDKAILEVFYGCGLRLFELIHIRENDLNASQHVLRVKGKGNKERVIPVPSAAWQAIEGYLNAKKNVGNINANSYLFVTNKGATMYPMMVWRLVRKYLLHAEAHPHLLRHSYATHLLDHGADIHAIKDLLGHSNLAATQVYTHTSLEKLKEVFRKAHPKA
jgi:integrase/recombinase XerC